MPDPALPGSALAARCTACSTVFRVVPDQLRVSDGWVRCGRCSQVFNAAENLIDLDTGAPRRLELRGPKSEAAAAGTFPPTPAPETAFADDAMAVTQPLYGPSPGGVPPDDAETGYGAEMPVASHAALEAAPSAVGPMPPDAAAVAGTERETASASASASASDWNSGPDSGSGSVSAEAPAAWPAAAPSAMQAEISTAVQAPVPEAASEAAPAAAPPEAGKGTEKETETETGAAAPVETPSSEPAAPLPSFVRQADRAARWRQPRVRLALAGGAAFAALLLAAQVTLAYRDLAAARWPGLRPVLEASCQRLGCRVGPAQSIEALTVESSGLARVEQTRLYQLTVALRNRAALDLAVPALELSLTDAQGRLLSRRVLQAAELGVTQPTVAAGRDLALQATLETAPSSTTDDSDGIVAGYTIELFYP